MPFGDAHDQRNPRVLGLENRVGGKRRRHKDHGRVGAGLCHGIGHGVEHRPALVRRSALARRHAADHLRAVLRAALGVEGAFLARNALHNQPRIFVNQNCHSYAPAAAATTISAASFIVAPTWKFRPDSFRIFRPSSTFVPSSRSTIGTLTFEIPRRRHHARRQPVHAQNAAEDIDEDRLHVLVRKQNLERVLNLLLRCAAAHVQKIRRAAACVLNNVHRRHRQARAVHHARNRAVELDVVQRVLARLHFQRIFFGNVAQRLDVGVAEQRVVVEGDLGVEREQLAVGRRDEGIDLDQRRVRSR